MILLNGESGYLDGEGIGKGCTIAIKKAGC